MYGRIPFSAPTVYQLFQVVQTEPLRFPEDPLVSDDLKDLLSQMLTKVKSWYHFMLLSGRQKYRAMIEAGPEFMKVHLPSQILTKIRC